jgi:acetylglutamate kinase
MKISLVKISGKTITEFVNTDKWIRTIKSLKKEYDGVVLVHGGGKSISAWSEKLGLENKFVNGQRVTTIEQMEVVAAVQAGMLNSQLTAKLNASGLNAMGLSGIDRGTFTAEYLNQDLGFVGKPELTGSVNWIISLIKSNVLPVFSSICMDKTGNLMNVNADVFAGTLASALNAEIVYFVSDVDGVKIGGTVKNTLTDEEIISGIANGDITDGMIPKLQSCMELLNKGINKIWIGSQIDNQSGFENGNTGNGTLIINKAVNQYELLRIA